jgi:transposase
MRELSVLEQRYQAVLAVISDGLSVSKVGVSCQTLHAWLARYEASGLEGLADRSYRPARCPHQIGAEVEAMPLELRRTRPYWAERAEARPVTVAFSHSKAQTDFHIFGGRGHSLTIDNG